MLRSVVGIMPGVVSRALRHAMYGVAGIALHMVVWALCHVWCVGVMLHGATGIIPHGIVGIIPHGIAGIVPHGATGIAPHVVSQSWLW